MASAVFQRIGLAAGTAQVTPPNQLAAESFGGSDGSAWPSQWITGGNGSATQQSGMGELASGNNSYGIETAYLNGMNASSDNEVVLTLQPQTTGEQYTVIGVSATQAASSQDPSQPNNGFVLAFSWASSGTTHNAELSRYVNGARNADVQGSFTWTTTTSMRIRLQKIGSTFRARWWATGQSEPSTWNLSTTDGNTIAAGKVWLSIEGGSPTANKNQRFDDIVVSSVATG